MAMLMLQRYQTRKIRGAGQNWTIYNIVEALTVGDEVSITDIETGQDRTFETMVTGLPSLALKGHMEHFKYLSEHIYKIATKKDT